MAQNDKQYVIIDKEEKEKSHFSVFTVFHKKYYASSTGKSFLYTSKRFQLDAKSSFQNLRNL